MTNLIVIVHHGSAELLDLCLGSLERAERRDTLVVVVLNGGGAEPSERYARESWVTMVHLEDGVGFGEANNIGVLRAQETKPDWRRVLFLNNDTRVAPDALRELHREFDRHPECAVVGPLMLIDGAPGYANSYGINITRSGEAWDEGIGLAVKPESEAHGNEVLAVTGAALMMRRDVFEQVGRWPTHYGFYFEDLDLCLRARSFGWTVRHAPQSRIAHRISASSDRIEDFKVIRSWANRFVLLASVWPWSLLLWQMPLIAAREIAICFKRLRLRARHDAALQVRSWFLALRRIPSALWARRRLGWHSAWTSRLVRTGSVPAIRLPDVGTIIDGDPI
jgi:GT2 family glycosyltransferase